MFVSVFTKRSARLVATTTAAFVAATIVAGSFNTAEAGSRKRAFLGGLAVGAVTTAIIAGERRRYRERRVYRRTSWERHVDRCFNAYRSYDEETDTWIDRRGRVRRCRL